LIAVAEEQNITRAAKRLFVAQPSLSAQIKSMEESLLVDLLVRAPKGIKLTPAAEVLTAGARQILALRDDVIAAARASQKVSIAPLRIGFSPFVDRSFGQGPGPCPLTLVRRIASEPTYGRMFLVRSLQWLYLTSPQSRDRTLWYTAMFGLWNPGESQHPVCS
jgi:hypothetical protein